MDEEVRLDLTSSLAHAVVLRIRRSNATGDSNVKRSETAEVGEKRLRQIFVSASQRRALKSRLSRDERRSE